MNCGTSSRESPVTGFCDSGVVHTDYFRQQLQKATIEYHTPDSYSAPPGSDLGPEDGTFERRSSCVTSVLPGRFIIDERE